MQRTRLIPVILLKNGLIVRSQLFRTHQAIGNVISTVSRLSSWNVDELVLLDISGDDAHDRRREDHGIRYRGRSTLDLLQQIADVCVMPLAFGGRIRSVEDMRSRLSAGADKCIINTTAHDNPAIITDAADHFGSQCVVISIDALRGEDGRLQVVVDNGRRATGVDPVAWAKEVERRGAGEIFLNAIHRDGCAKGYDLDLIRQVTEAVDIPVIACGGVGRYEHFAPGVREGGASALAAANIFNFFELSYPYAKQTCIAAGLNMRAAQVDSPWFPREPTYDKAAEDARIEARLTLARAGGIPESVKTSEPVHVSWCSNCTSQSAGAAYAEYDPEGVCMGCRTAEVKAAIPRSEWDRRLGLLRDILEQHRCRDGSRHDCVIGVSGGKDSYFQTHVVKNVLGFNPLLVTYYGNNYTTAGQRNLLRMKEAFGVDHIIVQPSVTLLKKLNRLAFVIMGDMNWHAHIGIATVPMRTAVRHRIPIVVWGEHGELDLSGQFSMDDFVEWTYRGRLEHEARSFEWNYMVGRDGITSQDLATWKYPTDTEIFELGLRGVYLGNYVYWEGHDHAQEMISRYGFEPADEPFERTYRTTSNLDDMHENGMHDYLKFIKFGYGRGTDHTTKDIRAGRLQRGQAVELVRRYDHVKSRDLYRWLDYVGMTEDEFDRIADTFRDPRVWRHDGKTWSKPNIWDQPRRDRGTDIG